MNGQNTAVKGVAVIRPKRLRTGFGIVVPMTVLLRCIVGIIACTFVMQSWVYADQLTARHADIAAWAETGQYGVLSPWSTPTDADASEERMLSKVATISRGLYPELEKRGALYMNAQEYHPANLASDRIHGVHERLYANLNYLRKYPLLGVDGKQISIERSERDWVVALPAPYRSDAKELRNILEYIRTDRVGDASTGVEGVVQYQAHSKYYSAVPDRFRSQRVKVVWTKPGQRVFTMDAEVSPGHGNSVSDPIVEIMTPSNTVDSDYEAAITGGMDGAMKIPIHGTAAHTRAALQPLLKRLGLNAQFPTLERANESVQMELSDISTQFRWTAAIGGAALALAMLFGVLAVLVAVNRTRRRLTVRRLHGWSRPAAYRSIGVGIGIVWCAQAALVLPACRRVPAVDLTGQTIATDDPMRALVLVSAMTVFEIVAALGTITITERRNSARRLKEL